MQVEFVNLKGVNRELQLKTREWRNASHVAKYFQIPYISLQTHIKWLNGLQEESPTTIAFLIKYEGRIAGLVYFSKINHIEHTTDWGMYIYEENMRGRGIGNKTLQWSIEFAKNSLKMKLVRLEVLLHNIGAMELYKKNGFQFIKSTKDNVASMLLFL